MRRSMTNRFSLSVIAAAFLVTTSLWAQQPAPAPAAPPAAAVRPRSPEIHRDHTVTFRLSAPKANEVTLNGAGAQTIDDAYERQLAAVKAGGVKFYWLGAGTTDTAREATVNLSQAVKKLGFETSYREIPGAHYWFLWRDFLTQFGPIMFQK